MPDSSWPVEWAGQQAIVVLPEHIDVNVASSLREQLLAIINSRAAVLIADMSGSVSCDHAGVDALARAYQRAEAAGTTLRLVVTASTVRRVLGVEGIDRLVSIYPSVEAALAAGTGHSEAGPALAAVTGRPAKLLAGEPLPSVGPALLWQLLDALGDGLVLTASDGEIVLVNRRFADMFGYQRGDLVGRQVETLLPADLQSAHRKYREAYARAPVARPMADRARLVGIRADGASIPVDISLTPVPTATGQFVLAVVRDATEAARRYDLADLARVAAGRPTRRGQDLLDRVVHRLFRVGLSLQAAVDLPGDVARERIVEALERLDDTIREIRDDAYTWHENSAETGHDQSGDA